MRSAVWHMSRRWSWSTEAMNLTDALNFYLRSVDEILERDSLGGA